MYGHYYIYTNFRNWNNFLLCYITKLIFRKKQNDKNNKIIRKINRIHIVENLFALSVKQQTKPLLWSQGLLH